MGDTVTWYESAEAVNSAYLRHLTESSGESLEGAMMVGVDPDGNEVQFTVGQMVDGLRAQGMWGFCDGTRIHAWAAPHVPEVKVIGFLAHELAHLRGADAPPIAAEEEAWAELVRSIAEEAVTLAWQRHTTMPTDASELSDLIRVLTDASRRGGP